MAPLDTKITPNDVCQVAITVFDMFVSASKNKRTFMGEYRAWCDAESDAIWADLMHDPEIRKMVKKGKLERPKKQ
jgi:hypothetical protein